MLFLLHRFIIRSHRSILVSAAILTVIAIILASRLRLDPNLLALIPADHPGTKSFYEITEKIGFQTLLIALIRIPPNVEPTDAQLFVDLFSRNLLNSAFVNEVEYKVNVTEQLFLSLAILKYLPYFLDDRGMERLGKKLSDTEILKQVHENKRLLMTPFGTAAKQLIFIDPLGLRKLLKPYLTGTPDKQLIKPFQGYYRTKDEKTYIVFVKPHNPPQDLVFSRNLMGEVSRIEKESLAEWSNKYEGLKEGLRISYAGGYPIAVNDEARAKRDIKVALLTSFLGVMILFGLSFRTFKVLVYVGIPLVVSLLWTLGFAKLVFHHLNILTCIFSCVLIGLGIDFAIHIVNRFFSQDMVDQDVSYRLDRTFQDAGTGIIIGGLTTAAAFYAIAISDFRGFKELGVLTGTGIIICLIAMIFLLPSLLVYFSHKAGSGKSIAIADFGLRPFLGLLQRFPKSILAGILIIFIVLAIQGREIRFDDNLKNFRPADDEVFQLQETVTRWIGGSIGEILLVAEGRSESDVMEFTASIFQALEELAESGSIAGIKSISRYIPAPSQQRKNMAFIRQHSNLFDMERINRCFKKGLKDNGFQRLASYDDYFKNLSAAFSSDAILLPSSIQEKELARFTRMFLFHDEVSYKSITYISPPKDLWLRADIHRFKEMINKKMQERGIDSSRYHLTGAYILTGELKELIIKNLRSSMGLVVLIISLILLFFYRRLTFFIVSVVPIIVGMAILLGVMAIFHLEFNFINLIVLPMIVGIGIDDGIHLTNTFRRYSNTGFFEAMSRTSRAIVLTSLTTLVGFGSIVLSHYPGLKSMGYVAVIGIGACMFTSIIILPPLFQLMNRRKRS